MIDYIIRRLILGIAVIFLVTIIAFLLIKIMPGDPIMIMLGENATPEQVQALRQELFLDRPIYQQYFLWLNNVIHGDLGKSIMYQEAVTKLFATKLPITFYLSILALIISAVLGIAAGVITAVRRGTLLDTIITFFANAGVALPLFWLGILLVYLFSLKLGWLPTSGFTSPFENFWLSLRQVILPVICLAVPTIALMARQTRSSMLEVIRQDYIRTAKSKGLTEPVIIYKHSLKNALIPIVTLLGMQLRNLVGGSMLVEVVFNIPGMGTLLVSSVFNRDFIVIQGGVLLVSVVVLFSNLIVDISYGWIDPRIRYR
ncbi:MAG: ABC transporter permease [Dehalococcoidales bacterium]|nr:ABC transporter permease [Dehalococcoidales bacterium]